MTQQIVTPIKCDNCGRMTLTYNIDAQGRKLCPVCITELSQAQARPGPSEVKDANAK